MYNVLILVMFVVIDVKSICFFCEGDIVCVVMYEVEVVVFCN